MRIQIRRRVNWNFIGLLLAAVAMAVPRTASADILHLDDVIIDGSLCVGFDCVNGESFGFDTQRLKENNLRIHFQDTSNTSSFPDNDWRIVINDSSNGGGEYFGIEDSSAGRIPFRVEAGARVNALYVDNVGDVGLGTSNPVVNLHIVDGNTPTVRLEQDGSSGFTPQTWDLAGNEANFFIRDVTNGSKLPFRITPNTPTSTIRMFVDHIAINDGAGNYDTQIKGDTDNNLFYADAATDRIGIGTDAPVQKLHIFQNNASPLFFQIQNNNGTFRGGVQGDGNTQFGGLEANDDLNLLAGGSTKMFVSAAGDVGIGNTNPQADLDIGTAATFSRITAGSAVISTSSRTLKENIQPVTSDEILEKVASVPVVTYDWKPEVWSGSEEERKNKMGLIAEDFHTIHQRGSDKQIDSREVEMTLWLAVQQLHATNKELKARLAQLEQQVEAEGTP